MILIATLRSSTELNESIGLHAAPGTKATAVTRDGRQDPVRTAAVDRSFDLAKRPTFMATPATSPGYRHSVRNANLSNYRARPAPAGVKPRQAQLRRSFRTKGEDL